MKHELGAVVQFIKRLLLAHNKDALLTEPQVTRFINCFCEIVRRHCIQVWLSKKPRNSAIMLYIKENRVDSHFVSACECTGISVRLLQQVLPTHLTIWIDPGYVTYRLGENGAIVTVYKNPN